jgi:hypothetical protein
VPSGLLGGDHVATPLQKLVMAPDDLIEAGAADPDCAGHVRTAEAAARCVGDDQVVAVELEVPPAILELAQSAKRLSLSHVIAAERRVLTGLIGAASVGSTIFPRRDPSGTGR